MIHRFRMVQNGAKNPLKNFNLEEVSPLNFSNLKIRLVYMGTCISKENWTLVTHKNCNY